MPGRYILYTDGAARGNPGPAAIGAVLYEEGDERPVAMMSRPLGVATNNVAEYQAVIDGLEAAGDFDPDELVVRADSQLLVRQLTGRYRVKAPGLVPLHRRAATLLTGFRSVRLEHVPRESNMVADSLANAALDGP
jgi:ribonuclease HI